MVKAEHSPELKDTPSIKPGTAQNAQAVHSQHKKENVNQISESAMAKTATSKPRTALCHLPESKAIAKDIGADMKSERGILLPTAKVTSTQIVPTEKITKDAAQPTVVFLRPGKVTVEARNPNASVQSARHVEKSAHSTHSVAQTGSQKCGQQDLLGVKYLGSVSPEEYMEQRSRNLPLSAPKGPKESLATYR